MIEIGSRVQNAKGNTGTVVEIYVCEYKDILYPEQDGVKVNWDGKRASTSYRKALTEIKCPNTGRSASACDSPDHRNCPDLRQADTRLTFEGK